MIKPLQFVSIMLFKNENTDKLPPILTNLIYCIIPAKVNTKIRSK